MGKTKGARRCIRDVGKGSGIKKRCRIGFGDQKEMSDRVHEP